jgi:hypothetical protein
VHLVLWGNGGLDVTLVSTPVTLFVLAGAGYGGVRLAIDAFRFLTWLGLRLGINGAPRRSTDD